MFLIKKIREDNLFIIIIFFISLLVNQYFGNKGIFPIDSFAFFDTGYRVLNGEHPFKDYWSVSGPFIDYTQALLFYIFGVNWQTYLLNSSLLNSIFVCSTFLFFQDLKLNNKLNLFFCICVSLLAYTTSGTPFVDHHSTFLSLISVFILARAINQNSSTCWILIPITLGLAFLSKQVPSSYIALSITFVIIYHFIFNENKSNNKNILKKLVLSGLIFIVLLLLVFSYFGINLKLFIEQYLLYPLTIGGERYSLDIFQFKNIFLNFKFIHLTFIPYFLINLFKFFRNINFYKSNNFKIFILVFLIYLSLIFHQINTKNQIYIFFLIPFFSGLSYIELCKIDFKWKKLILTSILILCFVTTIKYFERFNLERKFHELQNANFKYSLDAKDIDNIFYGLKWITPKIKSLEENKKEITRIQSIKVSLISDDRKKMIITNLSFFSILMKKSSNSPNRWFPMDGTGFPVLQSKFYKTYKNFFINIIMSKNIEVIYLLNDVDKKILFNYLEKNCLVESNSNVNFTIFLINPDCRDFNSKI